MGMPGNGHPALGVSRVEELPMAALLAAHHPTFALEPFEDLPHLHALMLARRVGTSIRRTTRLRHRGQCGQARSQGENRGCLQPMVRRQVSVR